MLQEIARFARDDSGAELVEWAVLTMIVLVTTAVVLVALRETITSTLRNVLRALGDDTLTEGLPR